MAKLTKRRARKPLVEHGRVAYGRTLRTEDHTERYTLQIDNLTTAYTLELYQEEAIAFAAFVAKQLTRKPSGTPGVSEYLRNADAFRAMADIYDGKGELP